MSRFHARREAYSAGRAAAELQGAYLPPVDPACHRDESFSICAGAEVVFFCPCFIVDGTAGWHDGTSSIPFWAPMADPDLREVAAVAVDYVQGLFDEIGFTRFKLLVNEHLEAALSGRFLLEDNTRLYGYIDLRLPEEELWRRIRRRYRPYINRGKARVRRTVVTSSRHLSAEVRDFVRRSAGMTDEIFEAMLDRLGRDAGVLLLFHLQDVLLGVVGAAPWRQFSADRDVAYEIGAYDHTLGFPAHYCLFDTARYLREQGPFERFYLIAGSPCARDPTDPRQAKLAGIDQFKRGLCTDTFIHPYRIVRSAGDRHSTARSQP